MYTSRTGEATDWGHPRATGFMSPPAFPGPSIVSALLQFVLSLMAELLPGGALDTHARTHAQSRKRFNWMPYTDRVSIFYFLLSLTFYPSILYHLHRHTVLCSISPWWSNDVTTQKGSGGSAGNQSSADSRTSWSQTHTRPSPSSGIKHLYCFALENV